MKNKIISNKKETKRFICGIKMYLKNNEITPNMLINKFNTKLNFAYVHFGSILIYMQSDQ